MVYRDLGALQVRSDAVGAASGTDHVRMGSLRRRMRVAATLTAAPASSSVPACLSTFNNRSARERAERPSTRTRITEGRSAPVAARIW